MTVTIYRRTQTTDSIDLVVGGTPLFWSPVPYVSSEPDRAVVSAKWDATDAQYSDELEALLADVEAQIARGESQSFDPDEL